MKARRVVVALAAAVLLTQSAPAFAQSIRAWKPVRQMTCGDFLLLDDAVKPEIVYWAATRDQRGGHVNAVIDVDATDSIVPVLVEKCREAPKASFWQTVKAETGRLGKKLYGPEPASMPAGRAHETTEDITSSTPSFRTTPQPISFTRGRSSRPTAPSAGIPPGPRARSLSAC